METEILSLSDPILIDSTDEFILVGNDYYLMFVDPTPNVTPTLTPTPTPTVIPVSPTQSNLPASSTPTPTRTPTSTPVINPSPTVTKTPTKTPNPTRTPTRTPTPFASKTPTPTPTSTPQPSRVYPDVLLTGINPNATQRVFILEFDPVPNAIGYRLFLDTPIDFRDGLYIDGSFYSRASGIVPTQTIIVDYGRARLYPNRIYLARVAVYFNNFTFAYSQTFVFTTDLN